MRSLPVIFLFIIFSGNLRGQPTGFPDHLRIGFGGGLNISHILDREPYSLYEDLTGIEYENSYTGILRNPGNQYYVQVEWYRENMILSVRPGTYTYHFSKLNNVIFNSETFTTETPVLLRYFSVPLEVRYKIDIRRLRPYGGGSLAYSHLLSSGEPSTGTFIKPRISAGLCLGSYVDLQYMILDLHIGYHFGLHTITNRSDRYATGSGTSFAQSDILLNDLSLTGSLLFPLQKQRRYSNTECYY